MSRRIASACFTTLLSGQVDRNRGSGSQARPDDRIKFTNQEVPYPLYIAFRNSCPSCSEQSENGANHQIRVAADDPEVFTDIAITDQKGPLWISIVIDQIDTVYRLADVARLYQRKPKAVIGKDPLQFHPPISSQSSITR